MNEEKKNRFSRPKIDLLPTRPDRQYVIGESKIPSTSWTGIEKNNGFYVMFMGIAGASKSTILANICLYLQDNYRVLQNRTIGNKSGTSYIDRIIQDLGKGKFPKSNDVYSLQQYDLDVIFPHDEHDNLNLVFIELGGEDIKAFAGNSEFDFHEDMEEFISRNNDRIIFIPVLPYEKTKLVDSDSSSFLEEADSKFDSTYVKFLSRIRGKCKYLGLIASKWDLNLESSDEQYLNPEHFIEERYPSMHSWVQGFDKCMMFTASIGKVDQIGPKLIPRIIELNRNDPRELINWIFKIALHDDMEDKIDFDLRQIGQEVIDNENFLNNILNQNKNEFVSLAKNLIDDVILKEELSPINEKVDEVKTRRKIFKE
jgi:hypothetical protein